MRRSRSGITEPSSLAAMLLTSAMRLETFVDRRLSSLNLRIFGGCLALARSCNTCSLCAGLSCEGTCLVCGDYVAFLNTLIEGRSLFCYESSKSLLYIVLMLECGDKNLI